MKLIGVGVEYIGVCDEGENWFYYCVIVDYMCVIGFFIVDGVLFLNEGWGYVFCWIM